MDRYAVIGNPVAHSKSPQIHAEFARQTGEPLTYSTLLAPLNDFRRAVASFIQSGGKGLNVTIPFKLEAFEFAHRLSKRAQAAGAVNTLSFNAGETAGDNTDGAGLVRDITHNLCFSMQGRNVLLLGAGGAARGVILPLFAEGPSMITIANRTVTRAEELVAHFSDQGRIEAVDFNALQDRQFDLIINATAASLGNDSLPIPLSVFTKDVLAYDMMYGKADMPFLNLARQAGAQTADGLGMLVEQAAESFYIWRGIRPDTTPVLKQLRVG
ncbi:MAG: shikimate dehydrogenase [Pseudomonadota bacterium]